MFSSPPILFVFCLLSFLARTESSRFSIYCGKMLDIENSAVLFNKIIHVENKLIVAITDFDNSEIAFIRSRAIRKSIDNSTIIDLSNHFVLPGLIDTHVHFFLREYSQYDWDDQVARESIGSRLLRAAKHTEITLMAGFTSTRDLGTEGALDMDLDLKKGIEEGSAIGPRIYIASRAIVSNGGYGPKGYNDSPYVGAEVADGMEEMRKVVRRQLNQGGADWIKIYGDYSRYYGKTFPLFTEEELRVAVREAAEVNAKVAVHAKESEAIIRAVKAGAASIEHGQSASDDALILMKQNDVIFVPTLAIYEYMAITFDDPARKIGFQQSINTFKKALSIGVKIVCGSDAGGFPHGRNSREIELMVENGMSNMAALKAATLDAALLIKHLDDPPFGILSPDSFADIIAVDGDPTKNIYDIRNVEFVMKEGQIFKNV